MKKIALPSESYFDKVAFGQSCLDKVAFKKATIYYASLYQVKMEYLVYLE